MLFNDRVEAGKRLAQALREFQGKDAVVLGVPRGGVVVAAEVARALGAPLDVVVTRKVGAPGEPEFALGAVTQEGEVILDVKAVESVGASREYLDGEIRRKREEVDERMKLLRGDAPFPRVEGKVVIIVDDGVATGSSVSAAVRSVRSRAPGEVVVAVPVAPRETVEKLAREGVKVVCLETPEPFFAIGEFYRDFRQVEDAEVIRLLYWSSGSADPPSGFE